MTIKLKRSTAAILIGLFGLLAGLAIGQVADAVSSDPTASASYTAPFEHELKKMNRTLSTISSNLGGPYAPNTIIEELEGVRDNTYATCKQLDAIAFCHY